MATTADYAPCQIPLVDIVAFDRKFPVHQGIVEDVLWVERQWRGRGGHAAYRVDSIWFYNCRRISGSSSWSQHAYGWAGDINPARNPFTSGPLITDMPRWFVDLWKVRGFGWGGEWRSVKDAMHYSKSPREGGNGRLFVPGDGPAPPPPPPPAPTGDWTVADLGVWKRGMKGTRVRLVQGALHAHRVPVVIDGDFGPGTDGGVRRFQGAHGLKVDGIVGPNTWRRLLTL